MQKVHSKKTVHVGYLFAAPISLKYEKAKSSNVIYEDLGAVAIRDHLYKSLTKYQGYTPTEAKEKVAKDLPQIKITNTEYSDLTQVRDVTWYHLKKRHGMNENLEKELYYVKLDDEDKAGTQVVLPAGLMDVGREHESIYQRKTVVLRAT